MVLCSNATALKRQETMNWGAKHCVLLQLATPQSIKPSRHMKQKQQMPLNVLYLLKGLFNKRSRFVFIERVIQYEISYWHHLGVLWPVGERGTLTADHCQGCLPLYGISRYMSPQSQ